MPFSAVALIWASPIFIVLPLKYKSLNLLVEDPKSYTSLALGIKWPVTEPCILCKAEPGMDAVGMFVGFHEISPPM